MHPRQGGDRGCAGRRGVDGGRAGDGSTWKAKGSRTDVYVVQSPCAHLESLYLTPREGQGQGYGGLGVQRRDYLVGGGKWEGGPKR